MTVGWCNSVMADCLWSDKAIMNVEGLREARIKNDGRVYHSQQRRFEYRVRTQILATLVRDHCGLLLDRFLFRLCDDLPEILKLAEARTIPRDSSGIPIRPPTSHLRP